MYGRDAPEKLMQQIISLEEEHARLLGTLPPHQRSHFRHRHISASSIPGALHRLLPYPCSDIYGRMLQRCTSRAGHICEEAFDHSVITVKGGWCNYATDI